MTSSESDCEETGVHIDLHDEFETGVPTVLYAEKGLGEPEGKTAHRLLHQGDIFQVKAVIDSKNNNKTVAEILPEIPVDDIPIYASYEQAAAAHNLNTFVIGTAPLGGQLSPDLIETIKSVLRDDINIVSGLHQHISDHEELQDILEVTDAAVHDIRKAPPEEQLRDADGRTENLDADVVTIMGTDCIAGKGTTTYELYQAAKCIGIDVAFVATGQTGILSGSRYGIPTDKIPVEYAVGAVEQVVYDAAQSNELVLVEAQAALTHPRFVGDDVLKGSQPDCVVLTDDPSKRNYEHFDVRKKGIQTEIEVIEAIGGTDVVAIATQAKNVQAVEQRYGIPAGNIIRKEGRSRIFDAVKEYLNL